MAQPSTRRSNAAVLGGLAAQNLSLANGDYVVAARLAGVAVSKATA